MVDIGFTLNVLTERRQFQVRERWTREQLESYQVDALQKIRDYAYANSPFYRDFHKGLHNAPLNELPVLTKAKMMDNFDELVTDRSVHLQDIKAYMDDPQRSKQFLGRYTINTTSGTSGRPAIVIFNSGEWANVMAAAFARTPLKLSFVHRTKIAQITSTSTFHMSAQGGSTFKGLLMPELMLAASEPLGSMVKQLNEWQPNILVVYASMGRILADEQLAGQLHIAPDTVMVGSEVLTDETRRRMVQAWSERVYNNYAATECGGIAIECDEHRGMHVMEDLLIVENVDRDNRPVPPGVYGDKILVTALFKYAQPLIRYEVEDSVRFANEPCTCGRAFRLIDGIQGRAQEVLAFTGIGGGVVKLHPILFHSIMDTLPVSGWQVVQETDGLHVLLAGIHGPVDDKQLESLIEQALTSHDAVARKVEVQRVDSIPQTVTGKTPLIKSNLPKNIIQVSGRSP